jgi:hypothetical protein
MYTYYFSTEIVLKFTDYDLKSASLPLKDDEAGRVS